MAQQCLPNKLNIPRKPTCSRMGSTVFFTHTLLVRFLPHRFAFSRVGRLSFLRERSLGSYSLDCPAQRCCFKPVEGGNREGEEVHRVEIWEGHSLPCRRPFATAARASCCFCTCHDCSTARDRSTNLLRPVLVLYPSLLRHAFVLFETTASSTAVAPSVLQHSPELPTAFVLFRVHIQLKSTLRVTYIGICS